MPHYSTSTPQTTYHCDDIGICLQNSYLFFFVKTRLAFYFIADGRNTSKKVSTVLATLSVLGEERSSDNEYTIALVNSKKT